jgi:hypothetical protein
MLHYNSHISQPRIDSKSRRGYANIGNSYDLGAPTILRFGYPDEAASKISGIP